MKENSLGKLVLVDELTFEGIDVGPQRPSLKPPPPTEAEIKAAKEEADRERIRLVAEANALKSARAPGEVGKPTPRPVDADGKPAAPKLLKPLTRKEQEAENRRLAAVADADKQALLDAALEEEAAEDAEDGIEPDEEDLEEMIDEDE